MMHDSDHDHFEGHEHAHAPSLDLGEEERLPWLESADDLEVEPEPHPGRRLLLLALVAVVVLVLLVDGIYWITHRQPAARPADGSLIEASKTPYKVAPDNPGGKQFAGTGDSSFKVSEGQHPDASLAGSTGTTPAPAPQPAATATPSPAPAAAPAPKPAPAPAAQAAHPAAGGIAVQVGAYSSSARAETEWQHMVAAHDALKGVSHRVVEGQADIGTVFRLQALAPDAGAANTLCSRLQADGVKCQVKR